MRTPKDRKIEALERRVSELEAALPDALLKDGIYDGQIVDVTHKTSVSGRRYSQLRIRLDVGRDVWFNIVHRYFQPLEEVAKGFGLDLPDLPAAVESELGSLVGRRCRADVHTQVWSPYGRPGRRMNGCRRLLPAR